MKQKAILFELRCDSEEQEFQMQETELHTGSLSAVRTHCILRYVRVENPCQRIDIFTKKLAVKALTI